VAHALATSAILLIPGADGGFTSPISLILATHFGD
jgi:hypothetical protein